MADIATIINVSLLETSSSVDRDNLNVVSLVTSSNEVLSTADPVRYYTKLADVSADFGASSEVAQYATTFFGTKPNPINYSGVLAIGFWRAASEATDPTAAVLEGEEIYEDAVLPILQTIADGSLSITVGEAEQQLSGMDFRTATTLAEVAAIIDAEITDATVTSDSLGLTISSNGKGDGSTLSYATGTGTGTFIGDTLGLTKGSGAVLTQGAASETLEAETPVEALTRIRAASNAYGYVMIDQPTTADDELVAAWAQAEGVLVYTVFSSPDNLLVSSDNVAWRIKQSGYTNYRMLYSKAGNRKLAVSYMARAHTVDFDAENSALTMNLKTLNVASESYSTTELLAAKTVGLDLYTTFKGEPATLTSGANGWTDNRYNLIGYTDAVQTDLFNVLKTTSTKVAQTQRGVNQLVDQLEKTTRGFVRAGVFAPGTWNSTDTLGDIDTFNRNIESKGFYFLAGLLGDQSTDSRQNRESPTIQGAVKNAGAIHSADIIINFNQ